MARFNWVCGWNVPGYLPDAEPQDCETWEEARNALIWELERWESFDPETAEADYANCEAVMAELRTAAPDQPLTTGAAMGSVCWIVAAETPFEEGAL